ncbi:hypothetical protein [Metabacillus fastidiosus]|uniref:hypothetical protein n=1 Tax=Metabacillus fastidiosus TaxID=1458 RepID=UPI002E223F53|nr:hypothetical protein [Metabacillus fastidiosus]
MKRLFTVLIALFLIYIIYYDFTVGTLPSTATLNHSTPVKQEKKKYFELQIKQGDTVLSIMEMKYKSSLPVSIEKIVEDFEQLNPNQKVETIKVGKTYKFPIYSTDNKSPS